MNGRPAFLRAGIGLLFALAIGAGVVFGAFAAVLAGGQASPSPVSPSGSLVAVGSSAPPASPTPSPTPEITATPTVTASPTPEPTATPEPTPTPKPTPRLVPAPLTGLPVTEAVAKRHVIAVMVDDHWDARPQCGFDAASIVWQAPAEGGIPRYMMLFQDGLPPSVGPVRSARFYFVAWAREWQSLYVHVGGSPQALRLPPLVEGHGGASTTRTSSAGAAAPLPVAHRRDRFAPHNVYTTASTCASSPSGRRQGRPDQAGVDVRPRRAARRCGRRAARSSCRTSQPHRYNYDRVTNTYLRSVTGEAKQIDRGTGKRVAPKNVVIMLMRFGPLNDGSPQAPPRGPRSSAPARPGSRPTARPSRAPGRRSRWRRRPASTVRTASR